MDFIFMLTRQDQTIEDCLDVLEEIIPSGVRHIGFKDIGVSAETLQSLNARIKDIGATSYMEVVSTTSQSVKKSLQMASALEVDCILGGRDIDAAHDILGDRIHRYYPFPGKPVGHPTKLGGKTEDITQDCHHFMKAGCGGVDLLAYRATEDNPLDLIKAARRAIGPQKRLIIAGSIDSAHRIGEISRAGADAFTIGSALFDGSFSPRKGSLVNMIRDVLAVSST